MHVFAKSQFEFLLFSVAGNKSMPAERVLLYTYGMLIFLATFPHSVYTNRIYHGPENRGN